MKVKSVSGVAYRVNDLKNTLSFYQKLGFRTGKQDDQSASVYLNWFWLEFNRAGGGSAESAPAVKHRAEMGNEALLYLSVEDLSETVLELRELGLNPTPEVVNQPKGRRETSICDPDGYRLVFFEQ